MMANVNTDYCCVNGCRNKQTDEKLTFFPLPEDAKRRAAWLEVIGRNDLLDSGETMYTVCSKHFGGTEMSEVAVHKLMLDAVPTKYLPTGLYVSPLIYEHDEGISDVGTQTNISYGVDKDKRGVFVEVFGRTVYIKKEKDPKIPNLSTFMLDTPINREPVDTEEPEIKKKNK